MVGLLPNKLCLQAGMAQVVLSSGGERKGSRVFRSADHIGRDYFISTDMTIAPCLLLMKNCSVTLGRPL